MKTLIAAVLFISVAAPVLARDHSFLITVDGVVVDTTQSDAGLIGRRSGACREGSRCGGV